MNSEIAVPSSLRLTKTEKEQNCPKLKRLNMNKPEDFHQMHNQILTKIVQHSLWSKQELLFISRRALAKSEIAFFIFKLQSPVNFLVKVIRESILHVAFNDLYWLTLAFSGR